MIKAVIFDMFETLITHYESPLYMGKQIASDMMIEERIFRKIWNSTDTDRTLGKITFEDVIKQIMKVNNVYSRGRFEEIVKKRKESKVECFRHLHPHVMPMLNKIKESGIKIGLITNCYYEEKEAIENSEMYSYFDKICMSCEMGIMKPDKDIFKICMEGMGVLPNECIYVGDGGSCELEAAKALGMNPVWATWYLKSEKNPMKTDKSQFREAVSPKDIIMLLQEKI